MKRSQVFPSTYLSKDDVTQPTTCVIQDVRLETIKGDSGPEEKPIIHLVGQQKGLVLNATNWGAIEEAYGDESDYWRGKPIELYIDPGVMYAGKKVGGLRVRVPSAAPSNGLGSPLSPSWSWEQAQREAEKVGITAAALIDHLKKHDRNAYRPARDTPLVLALIGSVRGLEPVPFARGEEEIPF